MKSNYFRFKSKKWKLSGSQGSKQIAEMEFIYCCSLFWHMALHKKSLSQFRHAWQNGDKFFLNFALKILCFSASTIFQTWLNNNGIRSMKGKYYIKKKENIQVRKRKEIYSNQEKENWEIEEEEQQQQDNNKCIRLRKQEIYGVYKFHSKIFWPHCERQNIWQTIALWRKISD